MNNEELKEYLTNNFSEILPPIGGYFQLKFKPDFYAKKILPVIMEKGVSEMKKTIENDSKVPMGYIGHFPPEPNTSEPITINELNNYKIKLLEASNAFSKNPSDPELAELLATINKQLKMLEEILI